MNELILYQVSGRDFHLTVEGVNSIDFKRDVARVLFMESKLQFWGRTTAKA